MSASHLRFWALVVLTGIGAGLGGAALMVLLRTVQHLTYAYHTGSFLHAVQAVPDSRRVLALLAAGVIAGVTLLLLRRFAGSHTGLSEAIWQHQGQMAPVRSFVSAVLSIVIVGMGASLGREEAPKETGAAVASMLSEWAHLSPEQRRLLVACGAGAGMGAVYNVPFIGLAAAAYVRLIAAAHAHAPTGWRIVPAPILVFGILGVLAFAYPQLLGNGKDVVQRVYVGDFSVSLLLTLVVLKPLATAACQGSGAPGGLFTPTLTVGAVLGALLGHGWAYLWPGTPRGSYALLGSAGLLAAATQGPISSVALVLELTHRAEALMVPLLVVVVEASLVARLLESRSIYSARATPE